MNVSAIIVTRGNVVLHPILGSLPGEWEILVWDNGRGELLRFAPGAHDVLELHDGKKADLAVYGRYAAIEYASGDLIYVQDDDVIVSDPQAILDAWWDKWHYATDDGMGDPVGPMGGDKGVVSNMPAAFRHDFYSDHCLVGFGACFHRDAPARAFRRFYGTHVKMEVEDLISGESAEYMPEGFLLRTCDIVFTALTPRVLVDVPYENLPWAKYKDRMYHQPEHVAERVRMLELVRKVRDGG